MARSVRTSVERENTPRKRRLRPNSSLILGAAVVGVMVFGALFAPYLTPYNPIELDIPARFQPPSLSHLFGTDQYGRDIFTRVLYGARYDLVIAVLAVSLAAGVGTPLGMVSGYFRGPSETLIMRSMDLLLAFPNLLLAMTLAAVLGPSLDNAILAVSIVGIAGYARIAYSATLSAANETYIEAAKALGAPHGRLLARAILPAILAPHRYPRDSGDGLYHLVGGGSRLYRFGARSPRRRSGAR